MKKIFLFSATLLLMSFNMPVFGADTNLASDKAVQGDFFKKKYAVKGQWEIIHDGEQRILRFSNEFKTKNGPDLKVLLSRLAETEANGGNAINGAFRLGALKKNKGTQDYVIPADVDLNQFQSVLIHCEAYSVLWGGGTLNPIP